MPLIKASWPQPSWPTIQRVIYTADASEETDYSTKSISLVDLAPGEVFARLDFPPCVRTAHKSYATVQLNREEHVDLNSDLGYINHSCEPSLFFDMDALVIVAGPNGLKAGQDLTFFYPSTEWDMAQSFECLCGAPSCLRRITGAKDMLPRLNGHRLNKHIIELAKEAEGESSA